MGKLSSLLNRIKKLEAALTGGGDTPKDPGPSKVKKKRQKQSAYGLYIGLCVDTLDIYKQNRVRIFSPLFNDPEEDVNSLPFAFPISSFGGFDDCGVSWVPPAGSTVIFGFEAGNRGVPFYLGTTWSTSRALPNQSNPDQPAFSVPVQEYEELYRGRRNGYLCGPNETQVLPPWNTESYNGFDIISPTDLETFPDPQKRVTYPNIYGFKTPEKHMFKMVDGDGRCNRKWKRIEIMSGNGNWLCFKDDHLHYGGQWAHPSCDLGANGKNPRDGDTSCIVGVSNPQPGSAEDVSLFDTDRAELANLIDELGFDPYQYDDYAGTLPNPALLNDIDPNLGQKLEANPGSTLCGANFKTIGGNPSNQSTPEKDLQKGTNPFFKQASECRPYGGPKTPQNNKCDLPQSGIQLLSISGHTFVMDDSVKDPRGGMEWQRSMEAFDFGCSDQFMGRTYWKSTTGHFIELNDIEVSTNVRGRNNGIKLQSALGNSISLCDEMAGPDCPSAATENQGIKIQSTSLHEITLSDAQNKQQQQNCRRGNNNPENKATNAYIRIKSGYGLRFEMRDSYSQEKTDTQQIILTSPQIDNTQRGPHAFVMQESPTGPGTVFLRTGGNYIVSTYDNYVDIVGDSENPSNKYSFTSNARYEVAEDLYYNQCNQFICRSDKQTFILAGKDYEQKPNADGTPREKVPGVFPVVVYANGRLIISDRVYASASPKACTASIYNMTPYVLETVSACKGR